MQVYDLTGEYIHPRFCSMSVLVLLSTAGARFLLKALVQCRGGLVGTSQLFPAA